MSQGLSICSFMAMLANKMHACAKNKCCWRCRGLKLTILWWHQQDTTKHLSNAVEPIIASQILPAVTHPFTYWVLLISSFTSIWHIAMFSYGTHCGCGVQVKSIKVGRVHIFRFDTWERTNSLNGWNEPESRWSVSKVCRSCGLSHRTNSYFSRGPSLALSFNDLAKACRVENHW